MYCHYFNNKKTCPFEEVGCMYKHAKSGNCWFKDLCKNKLCQYAHDVKKTANDTTVKAHIEETENTISDNLDQPKSQPTKPDRISCKVCFRWMNDENDLKNHMALNCKNSDEQYEQNDYDSESESETEEEDLECDECGKVSENFDAYIEHRGKGDCVFWCNNCDKFFRQEEDLKKHVDKHCTNCGKQFETKKACTSHMTTCRSI